MALRNFIGLGTTFNPFDPTGLATTSITKTISGELSKIIVDRTAALNGPGTISRLTNLSISPIAISNKPFSPFDPGTGQSHPLLVPEVFPMLFSKNSGPTSADTLFRDFNLQAFPFYNFWTEDETTNDKQPPGDRQFSEIPRFIKLTWDTAPDLYSQKLKSKYNKLNRGKLELKPGTTSFKFGVSFKPDHLQLENFSIGKNATANGFLSPGTLLSIIEIPDTKSRSITEKIDNIIENDIDEDLFLENPDSVGISIHELKLNSFQKYDSFANSTDTSFISTKPNGQLNLSSVDSTISMNSNTSKNLNQVVNDVDEVSSRFSFGTELNNNTLNLKFAKVNFIDPSITGIVNPKRVNTIKRVEHAEALMRAASTLPELQILSAMNIYDNDEDIKEILDKIPSFPSPEGLEAFEYVGYIIEKRIMRDGEFDLIETFEIPDVNTGEFYDSKILYGETYRYRIRSILRWTREKNSNNSSVFTSVLNSKTKSVTPFISSYFNGEWNAPWVYASVLDTIPPPPPDELLVRTDSKQKKIFVSIKIPDDSQRDIDKFRIYRKLRDDKDTEVTGWEIVSELSARNFLFVDEDVDYFEDNKIRYLYAAQTLSKHAEESVLSEQYSSRLNKNWKLQGEHPIKFVSNKGVNLSHFGSFSVRPFLKSLGELAFPMKREEGKEQSAEVPFQARERFSLTPSDDKQYVIRVESFDTGEVVEDGLNLTVNKQREKTREVPNIGDISFKRPVIDKLFPKWGKIF